MLQCGAKVLEFFFATCDLSWSLETKISPWKSSSAVNCFFSSTISPPADHNSLPQHNTVYFSPLNILKALLVGLHLWEVLSGLWRHIEYQQIMKLCHHRKFDPIIGEQASMKWTAMLSRKNVLFLLKEHFDQAGDQVDILNLFQLLHTALFHVHPVGQFNNAFTLRKLFLQYVEILSVPIISLNLLQTKN